MSGLLLSLFPGVGLLDRAFEELGWCVVRGPDLLWGGDVRRFTPPAGVFEGVIGGPPCQDFSGARRAPVTGDGVAMLREWCRVVAAAVAVAVGHDVIGRHVTDSVAAMSQQSAGPDTLPRCPVCEVVVRGGRKTCSVACRQTLSRRRRGVAKRRAVS